MSSSPYSKKELLPLTDYDDENNKWPLSSLPLLSLSILSRSISTSTSATSSSSSSTTSIMMGDEKTKMMPEGRRIIGHHQRIKIDPPPKNIVNASSSSEQKTNTIKHQNHYPFHHRCHNICRSSSCFNKRTMLLISSIAAVIFYIYQDFSFFVVSFSAKTKKKKKKKTTKHRNQEVQFVDPFFQHSNQLGYYGPDAGCVWKSFSIINNTLNSNTTSNDDNLLLRNLLLGGTRTGDNDEDEDDLFQSLDDIQNAALTDTICLPPLTTIPTGNNESNNISTTSHHNHNHLPHIFSTKQARECLMNDDVHLLITGDSYMKQLYIGLGDILLGRVSNQNYEGAGIRMKAVEKTQWILSQAGFTNIKYGCRQECYGESSMVTNCTNCISQQYNDYQKYNNTQVIPIVGSAIHIYEGLQFDVSKTVNELIEFTSKMQTLEVPMIFVTPQFYEISKVPPPYRLKNLQANEIYPKLLQELIKVKSKSKSMNHSSSLLKILDVYQLTKSCKFHNCTYDGGHRSRFVNRFKAQLLLNMICKIS